MKLQIKTCLTCSVRACIAFEQEDYKKGDYYYGTGSKQKHTG